MSSSLEKSPPEENNWLTPQESAALRYFLDHFKKGGSETYPLADSVVEGLFAVYLQGRSISEIRKLRPEFGLGQIVYAAVHGDWNNKIRDYVEIAAERAKIRAIIAIAEGVDIAADLMGALKKMHGDNIAMYTMTGDLKYLDRSGQTPMQAIRQLRDITETLMKLTGQEQRKNVQGTIEVKHTGLPSIPEAKREIPHDTEQSVLSSWAAREKDRIKKSLE